MKYRYFAIYDKKYKILWILMRDAVTPIIKRVIKCWKCFEAKRNENGKIVDAPVWCHKTYDKEHRITESIPDTM